MNRSNIVDSKYVLVPKRHDPSPMDISADVESKEPKGALRPKPLHTVRNGVFGLAAPPSSKKSVTNRKSPAQSRRGKKGKSKMGSQPSLPPQIDNTIQVNTVIRYTCFDSLTPVSASIADIYGALGGVALTSTLFRPWASSFRIKKIRAWPPQSASATDYVSIFWNSLTGFTKDEEKSKDLPEGITASGAVTLVPPKNSLAGDWMNGSITGTTNVFTIQSSNGAILDLHISFTLSNQFQPANIVLTAGTGGTIYYLALDGAASNTIVPTHLPTAH